MGAWILRRHYEGGSDTKHMVVLETWECGSTEIDRQTEERGDRHRGCKRDVCGVPPPV